jgi:hypothetical protein
MLLNYNLAQENYWHEIFLLGQRLTSKGKEYQFAESVETCKKVCVQKKSSNPAQIAAFALLRHHIMYIHIK